MMGLPNPYLILGAIVVAIGLYFYGHHEGWRERDLEMQAEIAKKNGAEIVGTDGFDQSIALTVPPLGCLLLKQRG